MRSLSQEQLSGSVYSSDKAFADFSASFAVLASCSF